MTVVERSGFFRGTCLANSLDQRSRAMTAAKRQPAPHGGKISQNEQRRDEGQERAIPQPPKQRRAPEDGDPDHEAGDGEHIREE
jgi:hypothetical protein